MVNFNFGKVFQVAQGMCEYSHVSFVISSYKIIHATKDNGVDFIYLRDFFNQSGIKFCVLRRPAFVESNDFEATYYFDQPYDSLIELAKRFLRKLPSSESQVCSSLVALMLTRLKIQPIDNPKIATPDSLFSYLGQRMLWQDVTTPISNTLL